MKDFAGALSSTTFNRRAMLKGTGGAAIALLLPQLLAACQSPAPTKLDDVNVLSIQPPVIGAHILAIIKQKELDRKHGLNLVQHNRNETSAYYNDLATGAVPINNLGGSFIWANMRVKGAPIKIVHTVGIERDVVLAQKARNDVNSLADLNGKRLAADRGSLSWALALRAAAASGVDLNQNVTVLPGTIPSMPLMVERGEAEGGIGIPGFYEKLMIEHQTG